MRIRRSFGVRTDHPIEIRKIDCLVYEGEITKQI